ncbi:prepilin-type N-terminal cleavage/methylation domain-containing protein [uncultured Thiodictyon sp.]|uniref:prepilin-type N-terminal cleavage/methylation domain-containing protein n=1 Tax=uncultured Thiodictyon sp. TaxID=1846217 RepID=UPI0025FED58C|nr:prepilin-type N-terminal cleavage/methylation domain-containing protein [uncultured Thiodictyon sp.]
MALSLPRSGGRAAGAHSPHRCRPRGFTLVELLIALAMVALITLLLFSGLRVGTRAWDLVEVTGERVGAVRLAHGFLVRALTQVRPATLVFDGAPAPVFAGDAQRVEFAAPLSEHVGVPGLYVLRLEVEGSGRRHDLVLTRWLMHPEVLGGKLDGVPQWEPLKSDSQRALAEIPLDQDAAAGAFGRTLLLEGVGGLVINYYGILAGEREPDWHKEWLEQPRPPILIRIHLTTVNQTWPDLIVPLSAPRG